MENEAIFNQITELPSMSTVIIDVLNFLNSGKEIDYVQLEKKILPDSGLTGRILGLANSPFFGMTGQITTIKDACFVLGLNSIQNLVISAAMLQQFPGDYEGSLDFKNIWKHSAGTASAAKIMAQYTNVSPEQAFVSGLLHDIGKMALDYYFQDKYQKVINYQSESDCSIREAEEYILGCNHAMVGGIIAEHWKLPEFVVRAIRHHHTKTYDSPNIEHVVQLADIVSKALNLGYSGDPYVSAISPELLKLLNIELKDIENNFLKIEVQAESLALLLSSA